MSGYGLARRDQAFRLADEYRLALEGSESDEEAAAEAIYAFLGVSADEDVLDDFLIRHAEALRARSV